MRPEFFKQLYNLMKDNPDVWALTGDLGYGGFDKIREDFPERFVNCGASEQAMVGIAVGLALKGKIPFVYSITTFLLRRPYETIKLYLDGEGIPVHLVGSGRDKDYEHDGPSHDATDAGALLLTTPNIAQYWPTTEESIWRTLDDMITSNKPSFLSLKR